MKNYLNVFIQSIDNTWENAFHDAVVDRADDIFENLKNIKSEKSEADM